MLFKNTQNSYPLRYVHEKSIYIIEKTKTINVIHMKKSETFLIWLNICLWYRVFRDFYLDIDRGGNNMPLQTL